VKQLRARKDRERTERLAARRQRDGGVAERSEGGAVPEQR
jgi:hypothetical protein